MNTATLSSKKQAALITSYMDGKSTKQFGLLPKVESLRSALAKRCLNILAMNRGAKRLIVNRNDKTQAAFWANVTFAMDTLALLGYHSYTVNVDKGETIWRRIRRDNSTGTYAILKASQKLITTAKYRIMYFVPPTNESGTDKYTDGFNHAIYLLGNDWYFGNTSGSLWVETHPSWKPNMPRPSWEEPFPTYEKDGILIHKEQDPNH